MANINRHWRKFVCCSCTHGHLEDAYAVGQFLGFVERYNPHERIHLGDYIDTAAFRTGAKGTEDEGVSLDSDAIAAVRFIKRYRPTKLINGNHDIRLWKHANDHNAVIAKCARGLIDDIRRAIPKNCTFLESYSTRSSFLRLGDTTLVHGWKYNVNAIRDTARTYGKVMMGHLHRVGTQRVDRISFSDDEPHVGATGYCVGYLGDVDKFDYAFARQATVEWQNGFAFGEYSDDHCEITLCARDSKTWRMPR